MKFAAEQQEHGQIAEWFGASGYIWDWAQATMENWQSEFLQLLAFVVLTTYFIHKGSHESKDTDEEMMAMLRRIEERLTRLEQARSAELQPWRACREICASAIKTDRAGSLLTLP